MSSDAVKAHPRWSTSLLPAEMPRRGRNANPATGSHRSSRDHDPAPNRPHLSGSQRSNPFYRTVPPDSSPTHFTSMPKGTGNRIKDHAPAISLSLVERVIWGEQAAPRERAPHGARRPPRILRPADRRRCRQAQPQRSPVAAGAPAPAPALPPPRELHPHARRPRKGGGS